MVPQQILAFLGVVLQFEKGVPPVECVKHAIECLLKPCLLGCVQAAVDLDEQLKAPFLQPALKRLKLMDSLAVDEMHPDAVEREVALAHPADLELQLPYILLLLPHEEGEQPFELLLVLGGLL